MTQTRSMTIGSKITALVTLMLLVTAILVGYIVIGAINSVQQARIYSLRDTAAGHLNASSGWRAIERGVGATMLGLANPPQELQTRMQSVQQSGDKELEAAFTAIENILAAEADQDLAKTYSELKNQYETVKNARRRLAGKNIGFDEWFRAITDNIEGAFLVRTVIFNPHVDNERILVFNSSTRAEIANLAEYAGRERATIGSIIADNSPIDPETMNLLIAYRAIVDNSATRVLALENLSYTPPELKSAIANFRSRFLRDFEELRQRVYSTSESKKENLAKIGNGSAPAYPVSGTEWIDRATMAINSALEISNTIGRLSAQSAQAIILEGRYNVIKGIIGLVFSVLLLILGLSVARSTKSIIKSFSDEMEYLTESAIDGQLSVRGRTEKINDEFQPLLQGVNELLDAVVTPLRATATQIAQISKGNLPDQIKEDYKGEFNDLKNNLNQLIAVENEIADIAQKLSVGNVEVSVTPRSESDRLLKSFAAMIENIKHDVDSVREMARGNLAINIKVMSEKDLMAKSLTDLRDVQRSIAESAQQIAEGDLTVKLKERSNKDTLVLALKSMLSSLNGLIREVNESANEVATSSNQISEASDSLSQGATESAASLEEISGSITEIASNVKDTANNAMTATSLATDTKTAAEEGNKRMTAMTRAMTDIQTASKNIAGIIKVIDDIAFQTNLLALNASVEAARAGRHGKGFAVVAEEVRNLAARSAKAAKETSAMIEDSLSKVESGSEIAVQTEKALAAITDSSTQVSALISKISDACREQDEGIGQVNQGLDQINMVVQQSTANSEETAAAAQELNGQARNLTRLLGRFKLSEEAHASEAAASQSYASSADDLIKWGPQYFINVEKIDNQHKKLVDLINEIFRGLKQGKANDVLDDVFEELVNYTQSHFTFEEMLMGQTDYPQFVQHKETHKRFVEKVGALKQEFSSKGASVGAEILNFLKDWLVSHIQAIDTKYVPYLEKKGLA